ncbi:MULTISPECIES: multiubiquitin domain-containing protein [unclassified Mesorhizobium]|uniref:multiubiquitin domain-containing protein n=1 Tax=unclassified Mesorhizobium TaxID=325217 RepID=UPI001937D8A7|nr:MULTISPECIES: multiubiquitin domain-containing protein [unclassified Mesorhizobium]BCG97224.1 hypothetical protein MesoLj131a_60880 [Mesorhizobium sp. 131-2-1]BCH04294.1 hypothetical protein MesoLj131b_62930 [Mesorhizobium sp. 131-2-5]
MTRTLTATIPSRRAVSGFNKRILQNADPAGSPYEVPKKDTISYAEVMTLAYPDYPQHPEITYSVTYTRGDGHKPEGILAPGGSVKVKEGMVFSVNRTGQS